MGKTRGRVMIDFATLDDLNRIVGAIEGGEPRPDGGHSSSDGN